MRKSLILCLTALFVLAGVSFGQEYQEVFNTGWLAADENQDGTADWKLMFMSFMSDLNGDGNPDFCVGKTSDLYYTDWTTTDLDFYGANFNPFWSLNDISDVPSYMSHADMDGDGTVEIVLTGRDGESTDLTTETIKSLIEVYQVGSSNLEWTLETGEGIQVVGLTSAGLKFDNNSTPDLFVVGDWLASFDSYIYRSSTANSYDVLWQSQGTDQMRILQNVDYDLNGDSEVFMCEETSSTSCELKLYDYDPGSDRMVRDHIWYRDDQFDIPDQVCDVDGDSSMELLIRPWDGMRGGWNLELLNGDSEEQLFSYGDQLLDKSTMFGLVFWEDGLGGHDLDNDGKADLLYYSRLMEENTQGDLQVTKIGCSVAEFENGTFVDRFVEDPNEELMSVQVYDLDNNGQRELCLYYFHWISTSSYTNRLVVLDPANNYQEKFRIEHSNEQPIGYTNPIWGSGVDLDGDGVGEFLLLVSKQGTNVQEKIEIYNGATGQMEWSKQYSVGTSILPEWANNRTEYAGITYPASDINGNGKIDFGIRESQVDENDNLIAARFTILEASGSTPPVLEINVATDKANYGTGEAMQPLIGGRNTGLSTMVDVYIAIVTPDGKICCAPNWEPGITPWIAGFNFPGGYILNPPVAFFNPFFLPCNTPPINVSGGYLFAGALTPPGNFTFLSLDTAAFNFGM